MRVSIKNCKEDLRQCNGLSLTVHKIILIKRTANTGTSNRIAAADAVIDWIQTKRLHWFGN